MGLTSKVDRKEVTRGSELENALKGQFNMLHSMDIWEDIEIENLLLKQRELEISLIKVRPDFPEGLVVFSPSSADKCERELFYKALRMKKDEQVQLPFQKRWTRNSTAVHEAVQRDLLYAEKYLPNPSFTVDRTKDDLPAWEKNIQDVKVIEHNGIKFALFGMMDGILNYKDGSKIGFEFKTKSTRIDVLNKMKKPSASHVRQCVAYSLLFNDSEGNPIDEYLLTYESVAKDDWMAGSSAIEDIKPFYVNISKRQKTNLLDKFARVAEMVANAEIPDKSTSKCIFCPYKTTCFKGE